MNDFDSLNEFPSFNFSKAISKANLKSNIPLIKITGSNGKSVTSSILSNIYVHNDYKVCSLYHLYVTAPYKNIAFNNESISLEEFNSYLERYKKIISKYKLSKWEAISLIFFAFVKEMNPDLVIVELDETYCQVESYLDEENEVLSILTSLSLDHTEELGSTLSLIASSYCLNFARESKLLCCKLDDDTKKVVFDLTKNNDSSFYEVDSYFSPHYNEKGNLVFSYRPFKELEIASEYLFYVEDACLAIEASKILSDKFPLKKEKIEEALLNLIDIDEGKRIKENIYLFSCSNLEAFTLLSKSFSIISKGNPFHIIVSLHSDKNLSSILPLLAINTSFITFTYASSLCRDEIGYSLYLDDFPYVKDPIEAVKQIKSKYPDDIIIVCGCREIVELMENEAKRR